MEKTDLRNYTRDELEAIVKSLGGNKNDSASLFECLYRLKAKTFNDIKGVNLKVLKLIESDYTLSPLKVSAKQESGKDKTIKMLLALPDGKKIETVIIPSNHGYSACVSSQAGCACGCAFCATGKIGFKRDLTAAEIIGQFMAAEQASGVKINNIIFMGMGEPFLNYENLIKSIHILTDHKGFAFPQTKITVSTCGIAPKIKVLADSGLRVNLAVSIVTADAKQRSKLMPVNKKYPLAEVIKAVKYYNQKSKRQVFFEYIMFDGVNDKAEDAEKLYELIKDIDCKVNLIVYNKVKGGEFSPSRDEKAKAFQKILVDKGIRTYQRREKGADILAACGQLAGET
ncbi:MAG: 23S rRNA (adenine(2503)-C(2))-methyltransferase RlmN [Candidatus Goldbacteria bacterium]|nr:23S rRNA (adenine(2503)-C(2))-methyltransferase RlmN [Candidatus Goldiibacteriota bacterium]